ncbi:serine protease FAM111A-like isoform X2 [Sander vitreus]
MTEMNGPMDKVVKEETDNQDGQPPLQPVPVPCAKLETSPGCTPHPLSQNQQGLAPEHRNPQVKQEEEPHATHSFEWCWSKEKPTTFTCNKARTIEDVLKRSHKFRHIAGKNQNKELVIVKDGKLISSHFPCSLIKNETLTVKYVKAVGKPEQPVSGSHRQRKVPSDELVMFHVLTKGGKNVVNIMRNQVLKTKFQKITVYAYKGDKVRHALKRDGRLLNTVFKKNIALSHESTEKETEMSSLVDGLDGETFQIILLNKSDPPESQPDSLDDAYVMQNKSQRSDSDVNQGPPQQSTTTKSLNDSKSKEKSMLDGNKAPENIFEILDLKMKQNHLSSQFNDLVKRKKTQQDKLSRIQNLFRVEYGKNVQTCREVKTIKKLMDLSHSVCQVRINGRAEGSGFLLFGKFVITNGHVVRDIYDESTGHLNERVTVHFSYESLDQIELGEAVEEVAGFEYGFDESGHIYDWALLRLGANQKLPDGLLTVTHFGSRPQMGGICIIGHPNGGVKKMDPCLIILPEYRNQVVERHHRENPEGVLPESPHYSENQEHIQVVTHRFFEDVKKDESNRQVLMYESCFYFGSSGSPVFDKHCNVVAMHSGGYGYHNARGESHSVIEYGYPLSGIIEHIVVQMVERGRFDVLKEYLACNYAQHQNMINNLKKLVESRNLTAFKSAVSNSVVTSDKSLKTFFEFFSQREEPVPMDSDPY